MKECEVEIKLCTQENQEISLKELNEKEKICESMKGDATESSTGYKSLIQRLRGQISKDSVNIEP